MEQVGWYMTLGPAVSITSVTSNSDFLNQGVNWAKLPEQGDYQLLFFLPSSAKFSWTMALEIQLLFRKNIFRLWKVLQIDGLVQKRRNSIANTLELRLSCTNPLKW